MHSTPTTDATEPTFAAWYRAHHPGLVEAVVRAVRPEALATDAVDEACARAFASWERVQAMRSPTGWVYRVAVHEARRQLRRTDREHVLLQTHRLPASVPPPGGEAWLCVGQLPIRQRTAVVLRHVAGMTEAEVAAAMSVTRSTVSSSLASAYKTLARGLRDDPKDSPAMTDANPPTTSEPSTITLAEARKCAPTGCDVDRLQGGSVFADYSAQVLDTIKVRPGDLVALEETMSGPTIVWRWWNGAVTHVGADSSVTAERNVTQRTPGDARRGPCEVDLPPELAGTVGVGERIWFGEEDGRLVAVAVAGAEHPARAVDQLPEIRRLLT